MERAQKIVDKMLQPHLERYARQKEELDQDRHKYYTTLPEIMVNPLNLSSLSKKINFKL